MKLLDSLIVSYKLQFSTPIRVFGQQVRALLLDTIDYTSVNYSSFQTQLSEPHPLLTEAKISTCQTVL